MLTLRALNEGGKITAGKVLSQYKGDWLYGRFEFRAKLNKSQGMWPALWMMPTESAYGGWPKSGEQDVMELLGDNPSKVYATLHWDEGGHKSTGGNYTLKSGNFAEDFHTFIYEWEAGVQRWYIDNETIPYFTAKRNLPFDKKFYIIMNLAVGGDWPGMPDNTTIYPNDMVIDFVRVYTRSVYSYGGKVDWGYS